MSQTHAHPYHLVPPSPWPVTGSAAAFVLAVGGIQFMHGSPPWLLLAGLGLVIFTMVGWWRTVIKEATVEKAHTSAVQTGLRLGMALFIASEVMFFVAFFWAFFFHGFQFNPSTEQWPPAGIETLNPWSLPFINTLILLSSGVTLMWGMKGLKKGNQSQLANGLALSVILGFLFLGLQIYEYGEATFAFTDGIYPSTFYMATGFHGFHVFVGAVFLAVCWFRARAGHFEHHSNVGLQAAEWYWHFVDVVWIFLFIWVYIWGGG